MSCGGFSKGSSPCDSGTEARVRMVLSPCDGGRGT